MEALERKIVPKAVSSAQSLQFKFLLVEDHPINQRLAFTMLQGLGGQGDVAVNGQLAVDAANRDKYDIIFMDVQMPIMSGLEAAKLIRNGLGPNTTTPIIALTANAMQSDLDKCMASGMCALLTKPFTKAGLRQMIQTHLVRFESA
jgi:CheY-like chemotaxis protein